MPVPIIVPYDHGKSSDNGAWRAHAMHCEECRKIYDEEKAKAERMDSIMHPILCVLFLALVSLLAFMIYDIIKNR